MLDRKIFFSAILQFFFNIFLFSTVASGIDQSLNLIEDIDDFKDEIKSIDGITFCENKAIRCDERDQIARRLEGASIFFGAVTVASSLCPEPFLTKTNAVIFSTLTLSSSVISFWVKGLKCTPSGVNFNNDERRLIILSICKELGKTYVPATSDIEAHCK